MFDLRIPLTLAAINSIKADLLRFLPAVKSSHRLEAVARGLGFRTYAAMRAACRDTPAPTVAATWQPFVGYLKEKGFEADAVHLYRAVAGVAIKLVLRKMPHLTIRGIESGRLDRNPDGTPETLEQYRARVRSTRLEMLNPYCVEEFLRSLALLARVKPIKTMSASNSYWLKHIAENYSCTYPDGHKLGPAYVANGALIAAAVHAGFRLQEHPDSPNVEFNMSKKSLNDLECECRPTGALAEQRRWREQARKARRIPRHPSAPVNAASP